MLTSWTDTTPTRPSQRSLCTAPEHLLPGSVAYWVEEPTTICPECQVPLATLVAPVVVQGYGQPFGTYLHKAGYCPSCPVVVVDDEQMENCLGDRADGAQVIGLLVGGASDRGSDSTVYPFAEVRQP